MKMKTVTRETYSALVSKNLDEWTDHPTEGYELSVMQWLDKEGKVAAQAIYHKPAPGSIVNPIYQIRD